MKNTSTNHVLKKVQPTKGELKGIGEIIFSTYEKTCKENLGKRFSEVLQSYTFSKSKVLMKRKTNGFNKSFSRSFVETKSCRCTCCSKNLVAISKQQALQSFEKLHKEKSLLEKTTWYEGALSHPQRSYWKHRTVAGRCEKVAS